MPKARVFLRRHLPLIILLAMALVLRVFIFWSITPRVLTDSITYLVLEDLHPVRTPGYPFFIEIVYFLSDLFSITHHYTGLIIFFQVFFLGLLNCYLIYALSKIITRSEGFSLVMGLIFNFDYFVIGFESLILTETLTLTLLLLTLLFYWKIFQGNASAPYLAGVFSAWCLLTRPTFAGLFVCLVAMTVLIHLGLISRSGFFKRFAKPIAIFALINLAAVGAWSWRNKLKYDYFGISTILPYQLSYYTGFFCNKYKAGSDRELDKYASILIQEKGQPYFFDARVSEQFHLSPAEISKILMKLNLKLILENPGDYLKLVPRAASYYFSYSWDWTGPQAQRLFFKKPFFAGPFRFFFSVYAKVFKNIFFLLLIILVIPVALIISRRKNKDVFHLLWLVEGTIHYNFILSVLLTNDGINNMRFRVPVEPFILLMFFSAVFLLGRDLIESVFRKPRKPLD